MGHTGTHIHTKQKQTTIVCTFWLLNESNERPDSQNFERSLEHEGTSEVGVAKRLV